ncbi:MAG: hypothetical protein KDC98_08615 [Planctomycetes bacterium]|nr:hypothetical protein [Planctomycetota bacterium]
MITRSCLSLAAAIAAAAAPLLAQNSSVFPVENTSVEGGAVEASFPFGYGISRAQAVLERAALTIPNGHQINQIRLRQKPGYSSATRLVQMSVYMGGTDKTAATVGADFLANYSNGTPRTLVFGPAVFTLPALSATSAPYNQCTLNLTTPYTYNANENLVLEFVVTANNNANQAFGYYVDAGYFISPVTSFGTGCLTSANQIPVLSGSGGYPGYQISFNLSQAPANSTLYFQMNVQPSPPISGAPFGAPGCSMLVYPLAAVLATAPGGSFYHTITLPNTPTLYGVDVYGQAIIFDLFANAFGFAASNGVQIEIGRLIPMAKVIAQGNASAATGGVQRYNGPILTFGHN